MDKTLDTQDTTQTPKDETLMGKETTPAGKEPSPGKPAQTYTKEQVDRAIQLDRMERGRDWKVLETERDSLKSQLRTKENELSNIGEEREELQKQIDDLSSKDPEVFNLMKKDKELRDKERKLKTDAQTLDVEKQTYSERFKKAETFERDVRIQEIADGYEGGDFSKLKDLCDSIEVKTDEQIMKVAETLWDKKVVEPPVKPYSGMTSGGTIDLSALSPDEKILYGLTHKK